VRPRAVMLVDDNLIFLRMLTRFLANQREVEVCVVGAVLGGRGAVAQADRLRPDVILLDLEMPDVSGLDLLPRLRATVPDARLIALTLLDPDTHQAMVLAAGADGFVSKASLEHDLIPAIQGLAPLAPRRDPCPCCRVDEDDPPRDARTLGALAGGPHAGHAGSAPPALAPR
jgi:DNA-binding NarL/FixJ family response regulator